MGEHETSTRVDGGPQSRPPRDASVGEIERREREEVLSRLEASGELTAAQRDVVADLARSIATALEQVAVAVPAARGADSGTGTKRETVCERGTRSPPDGA